MLGVLIVIFGLFALVLSPFAIFQVITKAGYSGWWTFLPYSPWIVGIIGGGVVGTFDTNQSIETTIDQLWLWDTLMILTSIFVMIMFFIFAFSEWPSLRGYRPRQRVQPGWPQAGGPGQPSWINAPSPVGASPYDASAPSAPSMATSPQGPRAQPSGWHRTGAVGAGEQAYWDGQAWTARRQWSNGAWVDLPMPATGPVEAGTVDAN